MHGELEVARAPAVRHAVLHPYYIVRVAGEPIDRMSLTETGATIAAVNARDALLADIRSRTETACTSLERVIPGLSETDKSLSRRVLDLKRSIHNLRHAKAGVVDSLSGVLDEEQLDRIKIIVADIDSALAMGTRVEDAYKTEIAETAENLRRIWQRANLQYGLSYTSPGLFHEYALLFSPAGHQLTEKKRRSLEDTLVQYVARCTTKTSPFSSFTVSHVGSWHDDERQSLDMAFGEGLERRVEFKSGLFHQIVDGWLLQYQNARTVFPLALNTSIQIVEGKARFHKRSEGNTVSGRTWGTGESVAELSVNPIVQCVMHAFRQSGHASMRSDELVRAVCTLAPKLQATAVDAFLQKLYDIGFLVVDTGLYEQTDVLQWGSKIFEGIKGEQGTLCRSQLAALQTDLAAFVTASPAERARIAGGVRNRVKALADALGAELTPAMATPAFFENCYLTEAGEDLSKEALEPFQEDLDILLKLALIVDSNQQLQTAFTDYFLSVYGETGVCTTPLEFLETFDAIYGVGRFGFVPEKDSLPPTSSVFQQFDRAVAALDDYLTPLLLSDSDVELDRAALVEILDRLPPAVVNRGMSHSFVGQLSTADGTRRFVINQVFGGRSSLLSRFLELVPEDGLARIRDYLTRTSRDGKYAELPAVFGFNANRHPRLADAEVVIPAYPSHWEESKKIDLRDLRLMYDRHTHKVDFVQDDDRILDIWYQGFLIPSLMPRAQRVLALIGTEGPVSYVIGTIMRRRTVAPDAVTIIPRVTLGRVVLSRRTYLVPRASIPSPDLPALDFFLAVQEWRTRHDLPTEVFVRTSPISAAGADTSAVDGVDWSEFAYKNLKPFYVKLDSPRMVRLLARAMSRNTFPLILAEVLPNLRDQHVTMAGEKHVAELHVELTVPAVGSDDRSAG